MSARGTSEKAAAFDAQIRSKRTDFNAPGNQLLKQKQKQKHKQKQKGAPVLATAYATATVYEVVMCVLYKGLFLGTMREAQPIIYSHNNNICVIFIRIIIFFKSYISHNDKRFTFHYSYNDTILNG